MNQAFILVAAFFISMFPTLAQEGQCMRTANQSVTEIITIREKMPYLLLKTDSATSVNEYREQTNRLLLKFVHSHFRYPPITRDVAISGTVVVSFMIGADGLIDSDSVVCRRDIGGGAGAEAIRIVKLMADLQWRWVPGEQRGIPVPVQFNLPVKIRQE